MDGLCVKCVECTLCSIRVLVRCFSCQPLLPFCSVLPRYDEEESENPLLHLLLTFHVFAQLSHLVALCQGACCSCLTSSCSETRWTVFGEHQTQDGREDEQHKAGAGILLSIQASKGLIEWYPVPARIIVARLKTRLQNITIIHSYAPTEQMDPEVKDKYYDEPNSCSTFGLTTGGTIFAHRRCHKVNWVSPDYKSQNQTDCITISSVWKRSLLDVKNKREADVGSDHNLVIAKIKLKIASDRDMKSYMKSKRTDAEKLNTPEIKE
ncbi:hypothetical protein Cfor_11846 [Coptotermes formosanus]|uniref:Endonuclease/exonuclease/phosphatase domain-containing protein n=1 Tax=Coptotermes formosanus TaxID=36987 RepID=A0A6L2PZ02_COPFO|nr:hypothetical protein Cfor_11846 [Coptotermes formosanus]